MTSLLPSQFRTLAAGLSSLLLSASCTYDKGQQDIPQPCSDTPAVVSYSLDIKPIIDKNCQACHGASVYLTQGGGHNWTDYRELQVYAKSGSLLGTIEHKNPLYAAVYMPRLVGTTKEGPRLQACDIERIRVWVNAGAPNN